MKKFKLDEKYVKISLYSLFVIILSMVSFRLINKPYEILATFGNVFRFVISVLYPFIIGFAIAYILNPGLIFFENYVFHRVQWIQAKPKLKRNISLVCLYAVFIGCIFFLFYYLLPEINKNVISLINVFERMNLQEIEKETERWMGDFFGGYASLETFLDTVFSMINNFFSDMPRLLTGLITGTINLAANILNIFLGLIISFYMLQEKEVHQKNFEVFIYAFSSRKFADQLVYFFSCANQVFKNFIGGKALDSLIIGCLCGIGMSLLHIPFTMLLSLIVGITNMIPYFGPFIGAIPAVFFTLFAAPQKVWIVIIFIFLLQQFDGNILGPYILGETTGLSPFWVILSIIVGGYLLGPIGMFIAVPLTALLKIFIVPYVRKKYGENTLDKD